jgi:hypothetical protein
MVPGSLAVACVDRFGFGDLLMVQQNPISVSQSESEHYGQGKGKRGGSKISPPESPRVFRSLVLCTVQSKQERERKQGSHQNRNSSTPY